MLGDYPDHYPLEEKLSIIDAYQKGGGVAGLADIIDHDDQAMQQQDHDPLNQNIQDGDYHQVDDNIEIDLENPTDVKIIEEEFKKIYDGVLEPLYGDQILNLDVMQKY